MAKQDPRNEARAVSRYLEALSEYKPRRGRKKNPDSLRRQITELDSKIESATPLRRLSMVQKRMDMQSELDALENASQLDDLEEEFVSAAGTYGERKGITYSAWREMGVPARVLQKAGIGR